MYKLFLKRIFDLFTALICIIILFPLFLFLGLAIKIDSKGPIFFKQDRVGKDKKIFKILKFRTMKQDTPKDVPTHLLENPSQYITKLGSFLRKTSLDELPQLFNIFLGDMSIIGPRPALWNQYDLITERDIYAANDIRPGLSGLAQTNGSDNLTIPEKAKLDGDYVKKVSLFLDLKIIFKTIIRVLKSDGIKEGKATFKSTTTNKIFEPELAATIDKNNEED